MESHSEVIARLRAAFRNGVTIPLQFRLSQLKALLDLMEENEPQIVDALHKDLAKVCIWEVTSALIYWAVFYYFSHLWQPKFEAVLSEIDMVRNDLYYTMNNLKTWMEPEYADKNLVSLSSVLSITICSVDLEITILREISIVVVFLIVKTKVSVT